MVTFKDLNLQKSYETKKDDLLGDFYIPVLNSCRNYDRISGFYSSSSLAIAAQGIAGMIRNGGHMRLVICPRLSKEDADVISNSVSSGRFDKYFDLDNIKDEFERDHVAALGWMLAKGYLEIKIAVVSARDDAEYERRVDSIMHQKVGILHDADYNGMSFSGSNNESASGWLENIEEFKVFREWEPGQYDYFKSDADKFSEFWTDTRQGVNVRTLPDSIKEKLIRIGTDFNIEKLALERYYKSKKPPFELVIKEVPKKKLNLFFYQKDAVKKWIENGRKLLLQMCTGSGKTCTAIGCMDVVLKEEPTIVVIACPQSTLSAQWMRVVATLDIQTHMSLMCDSSASSWRKDLNRMLSRLLAGWSKSKSLVIYTTHQTCSCDDFVRTIEAVQDVKKMFIGDEVHGMGSEEHSKGLLECYDYRLGLSATPSRWFDESGTALIESYFGNDSYVFDISSALSTINPLTGKPFLVNYKYHPEFVSLTDDELEEYRTLSDKIRKMSGSSNEEIRRALEFLLYRRANLEKRAEEKYSKLEDILDSMGHISDLIIFVSDGQMERVMRMLGKRNIIAHKFTQEEGTVPLPKYGNLSERDYLIKKFARGEYQVLVAIKCLDEGIDIPSASRAIIMASSTNPREYVQRIGRIIRQSDGKTSADIYDMIIRPSLTDVSEEFRKLENRIFRKEMDRVLDLSMNAINNADVVNTVYEVIGDIQ